MSEGKRVDAGHYYGQRREGGPLEDASAADGPPDYVVCRRVSDYPQGRPPKAARLGSCSRCGARIAFNPAGPHLDRPRVCMQCARIEPLPMEPPR